MTTLLAGLLLLMQGTTLAAVEQPSPNPPEPVNLSQPTIETLLNSARQALRRYRQDQIAQRKDLVTAALNFKAAIEKMRTSSTAEDLAEAQASLFWCKKEMDLKQMQLFLRDGHESPSPPASPSPPPIPVTVPAPESTPPPPIASPTVIAAPAAPLVETVFMRMSPTSDARIAAPVDLALRRARERVRSTYSVAYERSAVAAKMLLGRRLISDSRQMKDLAWRFVMLQEGLRLGIETEDLAAIAAAAADIGSTYNGASGRELMRHHIPPLIANAQIRPRLLELLDNPLDAHANFVVGRFLCLEADAWDLGLPLLTRGDDRRWAEQATADLTLAESAQPAGIHTLINGWEALGKEINPSQNGVLTRIAFWYRRLPSDPVTEQHLADLDRLLPMAIEQLDWEHLTTNMWDRLPGKMLFIPAKSDRIGPITTLLPGERLRVVAEPERRWTLSDGRTCTARGLAQATDAVPIPGFALGSLLMQIGTAPVTAVGETAGSGPLVLILNRAPGNHLGEIRVKLVPLDQPAP